MPIISFHSTNYVGVFYVFSDRTVIVDRPQPQTLVAGSDIILKCNATTDKSEKDKLQIRWLRDGENLTSDTDDRIKISKGGQQLIMSGSRVSDTGRYTCTADNGIDSDTVTVTVTIKGILCMHCLLLPIRHVYRDICLECFLMRPCTL